jgi:hypothetical protein
MRCENSSNNTFDHLMAIEGIRIIGPKMSFFVLPALKRGGE